MQVMVVAGCFIILAAIGIISARYLGNDNPVEEKIEELIEDGLEFTFQLPPDSLLDTIDLTPRSPEDE